MFNHKLDINIVAVSDYEEHPLADNQQYDWTALQKMEKYTNQQLTNHLQLNNSYNFSNTVNLIANQSEDDIKNHIYPQCHIRPKTGIYLGYKTTTKQHRFLVVQGGNYYFINVFLCSEQLWHQQNKKMAKQKNKIIDYNQAKSA